MINHIVNKIKNISDVGKAGNNSSLNEITELAYSAMTSNGEIDLTFHIYKLSFLNFLLGKQPNGPGQFMFGHVHASTSNPFHIDVSNGCSTTDSSQTPSTDFADPPAIDQINDLPVYSTTRLLQHRFSVDSNQRHSSKSTQDVLERRKSVFV